MTLTKRREDLVTRAIVECNQLASTFAELAALEARAGNIYQSQYDELFRRALTKKVGNLRNKPRPLPEPVDPPFTRSAGDMICETCKLEYRAHPWDREHLDYRQEPFLRVLCDGTLVKL